MVENFDAEKNESYDPWATDYQETESDFPYDPTGDSQEVESDENQEVTEESDFDDIPSGEQDSTDESEEGEVNLTYFMANALKERGVIDVEELPEDLTEEELLQIYANSHEERIRAAEEQKLLATLEQRGITEQNLTMAMAIQNGYSPDMLLEQNRYKAFADLRGQDTVDRSVKEQVIREYLRTRDFFDDEIERRMEDLELDDDLFEKDFERATEKFAGLYEDFRRDNEYMTQQREAQILEKQRHNQQLLENIRSTGQISGEKFTRTQLEDFERGLFYQDQVVEVNGQPYRASKFDKFILEFQNNFETQLLAFKLMEFRNMDKQIITQEAQAKAEESLFKELKNRLEKQSNKPLPKTTIKKSVDGRTFQVSKTAKVISV